MKHTIKIMVAALAVSAALATPSAGKEVEEINQMYQVGTDARLSLSNLNGSARITGWDRNTIDVKATKRTKGTRKGLEAATVDFVLNDDHLRIEVKYDFDDDRWHDDDDLVEVEFEIKMPRGAEINAIEVVNGNLEISNFSGDVEASSVNGDVTATQLSGEVRLSTVNGDVSLESVIDHDTIRLNSVNGSVSVLLPRNVNAKLSASTIHGDVRGDLGHGVTHAGSSMDAVLGNGGPRITLSTVNGDIKIRRADGKDTRKSDRDSDDDNE
jgi:DUF4097 and DUF4098 domain-containing protein YvlB